ncbi:T9SS type A sorting domain-containing protein [Aquimarina aggregata]|uniref:T9SS type A sorting domain-containing protein n=1 Tax=Aquimarina aggregata TaxID=1642818 RepID=UPI00249178CF|nr:T9SS type A sorting domain-containing protein [Aquimarina aggregata]
MKTKQLFKMLMLLPLFTGTFAQDWKNVPIPANPGTGKVWQIQNQHSDDFNYNGKNATFNSKWLDNHRAGWSGPGETQFSANHSAVTGGNLQIKAGRVTNIQGKTTFCGHVTTKTPVIYPVFTEVRMKCSGINLSSNFWLLSADDVNEIDVTETYGAEDFAGRRMATNYHIFQRSPFLDLANSPKSYASNGNVPLKNDYHRFGLYWKSATEFDFYFDGVLVRTLNRSNDLKDPRNRFFDQAMHLILNTELHSWKSNAGIRPSNTELNNNAINTLYFDWIRTYKPIVDTTNDVTIPDGVYYIKKASSNIYLKATAALGNTISINNNTEQATQWKFTKVGNSEYSINSVAYPQGRLEVPFGKKGRGVKVATTNWTGSASHIIWKAEKVGNNYIFIPKHDPLHALDIWEGNSIVHTWNKNPGNSNQVISLIPVNKISNQENIIPQNLITNHEHTSRNQITVTKDNSISKALTIFPNPVKNMLYLKETPKETTQLRVTNLKGKSEIIKKTNTNTLDVSQLNPGVYVLKITTPSGEQEVKFVKE